MRFKTTVILNLLIFNSFQAFSQTPSVGDGRILTLVDFLKSVAQNHPVTRQGALIDRAAKAELLAAQGQHLENSLI